MSAISRESSSSGTMRGRLTINAVVCVAALAAAVVGFAADQPVGQFDVVLAGGRVMDPASGLDAVRHVGIRGGTIAAVSATPLTGQAIVDVSGRPYRDLQAELAAALAAQ